MSRSLHAALVAVVALLLSGCGTPSGSAPALDSAVVVEAPPEPTCAPADTTSNTPPEPTAGYRDGATYTC
jgi:hypothetical protein